MSEFVDNPERDFRKRDWLPEIWILDPYSNFGIEYSTYSRKIVNLLPAHDCKVLDAGCGCGRMSSIITQKGHEVTGIDYSERPIKFAKMLVPKAKFFQVDLREVNKKSWLRDTFDATILADVLEHIPPSYHDLVISNLVATLKDDGLLIISVPSVLRTPVNKWHYKHFTLDEIVEMLEKAGMTVKKIHFDHRVCLTQSLILKLWRLIENRWWDFRFLRKSVIKPIYEKFLANPNDVTNSGRYIVVAQKRK